MKFKLKYLWSFIALLTIEILIAKYATGFIRHTIGDYLVVILIYCLIRSLLNISFEKAAIISLIISFIVEFLQLTNLEKTYPAEYSNILKILIGTSFSFGDLIAYTFGFTTIFLIENHIKKQA